QEVYVTGSFDSWSKSAPLVKNVDGSWSTTIPLPSEKITYKFVVDNDWVVDHDAKTETDDAGNTNNVIDMDDIAVSVANNRPAGFIPESAMPITIPAPEPTATTTAPEPEPEPEPAQSHAPEPAPEPEPEQAQTQGTAVLATPGIVLPKNANEISAFKEISTVDAASLN
ncbi:immunoglobulin E-set, partial [Lipomyces arxii]|uniref:immunoglobulin E-set n=1 Tax=Lipomyces arxii TaxID=56418 RepID=UPI0034CD75DF